MNNNQKALTDNIIIIYAITLALVILTSVLHFNIDEISDELSFYRINCANHLIFTIARIAEALVPTTVTFGFTVLISTGENSNSFNPSILKALLTILAMVGLVYPSMGDLLLFGVFTVLIYLICGYSLVLLWKITSSSKKQHGKHEKSDGVL